VLGPRAAACVGGSRERERERSAGSRGAYPITHTNSLTLTLTGIATRVPPFVRTRLPEISGGLPLCLRF
jgi:hypothetical protein